MNIQKYLSQYYSDMNAENKAILNFIRFVPSSAKTALDFSYGGSLMITAELSKTVKKIDLSDIDEKALHSTLQFKKALGFNWLPLFTEIGVSPAQVQNAIDQLLIARFPASLPKKYDLITCFFALESASDSWRSLLLYYNSLLQHVSPDGWLVIGLFTEPYKDVLGSPKSLYITSELFLDYFKPDIFQQIKACADWGYKGMLFSAQQNHSRP